MGQQNKIMDALNDHRKPTGIHIDEFGNIDVAHLCRQAGNVKEAFDLRMRLAAYWKIVLKRLVDCMALHMVFGIQKLVNKEMEGEIVSELMGGQGKGLEKMMGGISQRC
ncbi:hypothetical protein ACS0TY_004269 [Phlomoides rotata]